MSAALGLAESGTPDFDSDDELNLKESDSESSSSGSDRSSDEDSWPEGSDGLRPSSDPSPFQIKNSGPDILRSSQVSEHAETEVEWTVYESLIKNVEFKKKQMMLATTLGKEPIDFFDLLVDDSFLASLVKETNRYAFHVHCRPGTKKNSRITQWKDLDVKEFRVFLGLLLHMGTIQLNRVQDYWKTSRLFDIPIFPQQMSRNRFSVIMACLHFNSKSATPNRLEKVKPLVDYFNSKMNTTYYPDRELSLDEGIALLRGKLVSEKMMSRKKRERVMKLYALSETNGLVLNFLVSPGTKGDHGHPVQTDKIAMKLLEGKLKNGHSVFMDDCYSSYDLARKLLSFNTYCTGMLRADRANNPTEMVQRKLANKEHASMFAGGVHVGKWKSRKNLLYITTEFGEEFAIAKNGQGTESAKPKALVELSKNGTLSDRICQLMYYCPSVTETIKWHKRMFIHVVQLLLMNAHKLYNKYSGRCNMDFYDFRLSVIESLLRPQNEKHKRNYASAGAAHKIAKIKERDKGNRVLRKRCRLCSKRGIYKRSRYHCEACKEKPGLCIECFDEYHTFF